MVCVALRWKFKQAIELGTVNVTRSEFEKVLQELKDAFPASTYDLIHRNCNHVSGLRKCNGKISPRLSVADGSGGACSTVHHCRRQAAWRVWQVSRLGEPRCELGQYVHGST